VSCARDHRFGPQRDQFRQHGSLLRCCRRCNSSSRGGRRNNNFLPTNARAIESVLNWRKAAIVPAEKGFGPRLDHPSNYAGARQI
jgi:hypothetical protein